MGIDDFVSEFDQNNEMFLRTFPYLLRSYYEKLLETGFTKKQAFDLVIEYQKIILGNTSPDPGNEEENG